MSMRTICRKHINATVFDKVVFSAGFLTQTWWHIDYGAAPVINRSRVRLPAAPLSGTDPGKLYHACSTVTISHQAV